MAEYVPYMDGPRQTVAEQAAYAGWYQKFQDSIAACMTARGFRYTPNSYNSVPLPDGWRGYSLRFVWVPFLDPDRTVVERNGYGVLGDPNEEASGMSDANMAYVESLSKDEREAYYFALLGDYKIPSTKGSCSQLAGDKFPQPTDHDDRVAVFMAEYGEVIQAANQVLVLGFYNDPSASVVAVNDQWWDCMSTKGLKLDHNAGHTPRNALVLAFRTRPDGTVDPPWSAIPDGDVEPDEVISLSGTVPERAVALADYDCRVATDYLAQIIRIRVQMDNDFIAANYEALQRLKNQ
jgi:hypothetical protein